MQTSCHILNIVIENKNYPAVWKKTRVITPYKNGPDTEMSYYRPIAVLSVFAKIFQSVMYTSIYNQIRSWFCTEQHGFLPRRSTSTNTVDINTLPASNMSSKVQNDATCIDFKKAFDRVDNDTFLNKMIQAGFSNVLLELFSSYLSDRLQYGHYRNIHSKF